VPAARPEHTEPDARSILGSRDAIVLIPREPLTFGSRYRVQIEVNGQQINWTFGVEHLSS
jgi:hypothetical protein